MELPQLDLNSTCCYMKYQQQNIFGGWPNDWTQHTTNGAKTLFRDYATAIGNVPTGTKRRPYRYALEPVVCPELAAAQSAHDLLEIENENLDLENENLNIENLKESAKNALTEKKIIPIIIIALIIIAGYFLFKKSSKSKS